MVDLAPRRRSRRPSLTPMIDVVFLLLVFFMLAARFGVDTLVPLTLGGTAGERRYEGPPRVVDVLAQEIRLNGTTVDAAALPERLSRLMEGPADVIVVRAAEGVALQRLMDALGTLEAAGFSTFVVVE